MLDEPATIAKKIRSRRHRLGQRGPRAAPDKPGISNLIEILAAVRGIAPEAVEREFDGSGYGAFKQAVADAVVEYLAPVRERYERAPRRRGGARADARRRAPRRPARSPSDTLADVREAMGVGPVRARR